MSVHVPQIDHEELFVPDRREAAEWYAKVLGHRLEATTYDHEVVRAARRERAAT